MERRNQVEQGRHPFRAQRVQDLVHAGGGQLAHAADLVEFLVVDGDPDASRLTLDDHQRARIRRGRLLNLVCRDVLAQGGVKFHGKYWVDPVGPGFDGRAILRDHLERHQGAATKLRLGLGENVRRIAENITQVFDC